MRSYKVCVFEDTFGTHHHAQLKAQGFDPAGAYVVREVIVPDNEPIPQSLIEASAFCGDAKLYESGCVDWPNRSGRHPIRDTRRLLCEGEIRDVKIFVGFTFPAADRN